MAKYLKQDSELGYVEDSAEIEYLKFNNLRHTILGYMWGDFNSSGEYVLSPEIQHEMIAMPKYVVETIDNIDVCLGNVKFDKQITFMVTTEGNRATLSLVEKISFEANNKLNSGTYSNINEYVLDEVETSGVVDKNALYRRWNISTAPSEVLDIFHMDEESLATLFGLVSRFKYLIKANAILLKSEEKLEEIEAEYSVNLLSIIDHYPKLKVLVDEDLKKTLSEKKDFIRIDRPNFAKTLNEVIEKSINSNMNVLTDEEKADLLAERRNAQLAYNIKSRDEIAVKTEKIETNRAERIDTNNLESVELREDSFDNELDAKKRDRIVLDTQNLERDMSVVDLMKETLQAEKEVIGRTEAEAVAVNVGAVRESAKENASKLIEAIRENGKELVPRSESEQGEQVQSSRAQLLKALTNRGAEVNANISPSTNKQITERQKKQEIESTTAPATADTNKEKKNEVQSTPKSPAPTKSVSPSAGGSKGGSGGGKGNKGESKKDNSNKSTNNKTSSKQEEKKVPENRSADSSDRRIISRVNADGVRAKTRQTQIEEGPIKVEIMHMGEINRINKINSEFLSIKEQRDITRVKEEPIQQVERTRKSNLGKVDDTAENKSNVEELKSGF